MFINIRGNRTAIAKRPHNNPMEGKTMLHEIQKNLTAAKKLAASGDKQALQAEVHYLKEIIKQTEARLKETKALAVQFDYAFYQEQDFQYAAKEAYTQTRKMFTWR